MAQPTAVRSLSEGCPLERHFGLAEDPVQVLTAVAMSAATFAYLWRRREKGRPWGWTRDGEDMNRLGSGNRAIVAPIGASCATWGESQ